MICENCNNGIGIDYGNIVLCNDCLPEYAQCVTCNDYHLAKEMHEFTRTYERGKVCEVGLVCEFCHGVG